MQIAKLRRTSTCRRDPSRDLLHHGEDRPLWSPYLFPTPQCLEYNLYFRPIQQQAHVSALQVKPDGVQRGLVGEIIGRFERKGFTLRGLKLFTPKKQLAEEHYKDLSQKPFFKDLVDYITSGPVVAMVRRRMPLCF